MDMMKLITTPSIAMKKNKKRSIVSSLPRDLLVQIVMHVASNSSTPMKDVKSLRATCKKFYQSSKDRLVGRSMAVIKEWEMKWFGQTDDYFALLRHCAKSDNLEAYFVLGFEEIFNLEKKAQGLQHLKRAVDGGHLVAAYLMGFILFLDTDTQSEAMEILNKVSSGDLFCDSTKVTESTRSGNPIVDRCRREAIEIAWRSWKKFKMEARLPCKHQLCGTIIKAKNINYWMEDDRLPRVYCSPICRWTDEYHRFWQKI